MISFVEPNQAEKNIKKQATKILKSLLEAYSTGLLDDPTASFNYCSLLACICEGKVQGHYNEERGLVEWSLTEDYRDQIESFREVLEKEAKGHVVRGPWS